MSFFVYIFVLIWKHSGIERISGFKCHSGNAMWLRPVISVLGVVPAFHVIIQIINKDA